MAIGFIYFDLISYSRVVREANVHEGFNGSVNLQTALDYHWPKTFLGVLTEYRYYYSTGPSDENGPMSGGVSGVLFSKFLKSGFSKLIDFFIYKHHSLSTKFANFSSVWR